MVNEPMPWQLTVGQLRRALAEVPDELVMAPGIGHPDLAVFYNLRVEYGGGVIVRLHPVSTSPVDADESPSP